MSGARGARPLLEFAHVTVAYGTRVALRDACLSVMPGESLVVVGESGSGKSTVVGAAMGLLGPGGVVAGGDVWFGDVNVTDAAPRVARGLRGPGMGLVAQDCMASLDPARTVGAQAHDALSAHGRVTRAESDRRARALLARLGLADPDRILACRPHELSGGMGQRVGLCLALLPRPRLLLADEPTSALDAIARAQVLRELARVRDEAGTALVVVTHDMAVAASLADTLLVLDAGRVAEYGTARRVLSHPADDRTRALLEAARALA